MPHAQLRSPQQVTVHATGFAPAEALQVVECAQKGTATGPGDCNLEAMQSGVADEHGALTTTITVVRGPFGANRIVCDARQACLVSVTQASLSPTDEADAPITFATP